MANNQSGQGQGAVNHPDTDHRLKEHGGGTHGQGQVKDAGTDGRLKDGSSSGSHSGSGQGQVKDPKHDGRLKENRK